MTSKNNSSAAGGGIDKMASVKRIAVVAAVVLLLSMAVVGSVSADDSYTVTITTTPNASISGDHGVTYAYSTDGGTTYVAYSTPFDVTDGTEVTIKAICSNSIVRPQDWDIPTNVTYSSITKDYGKVTFTMPASAVGVTVTEGKVMPVEYREVEYIESTGTQYINTGVYGDIRDIYIDFSATYSGGADSLTGLFGSFESKLELENYGSKLDFVYGRNVDRYLCESGETFDGTITTTNGEIYFNGTYIATESTMPTSFVNYPFTLFAKASSGSSGYIVGIGPEGMLLRNCKLYSSAEILILNVIPCIRLSDSAVGMYDLVTGNFLENSGEGSFTAGPSINYILIYDGNNATGGSAPVDSNSPYWPSSIVTVLGNTANLTKTGYTFAGWGMTADGSGTVYGPGDNQTHTFTISGDTTLYAKWDYTVIYNANGGSGNVPETQSSCYGQSITVSAAPENLSKSGSVFAGWKVCNNATGEFTNEVVYPGDTYPGTAYDKIGDVTLYANWVSPSFTFTIPASVPLSQDTTQKVTGDSCVVTIGSNQSVAGKVLRVNVSSEASDDGSKKTLFSLSGTGGNATYKVGKWDGESAGDYIEGNDPSAAYGNEVVNLDISSGTDLSASQQLFFETKSYDGAGSYSGVLNFAFEVTTKVTGITISGPTLVNPGKSITLTANFLPTDASDKTVTWSSSKENVATVDANGIVTGVSGGTVTITATAKDGSGVYGTYSVEVKGLPDGYTEVEYIESTGTQYIDSGFDFGTISLIDLDFVQTGSTNHIYRNYVVFGANSNQDEVILIFKDGTNNYINGNVFDYKFELNKKYAIKMNLTPGELSLIVNDEVAFSSSSTKTNNGKKIYLFGGIGGNTTNIIDSFAKMKLYSATLKVGNNTEKRRYVPCIRETDEKIGLYDWVSKKFYPNDATSGDDFIAGPVVDPVTTSVTGIALDKSLASVKAGETVTLTATVSPTDATYKYVNWSSSDQSVAYVRNGVVTGVKAGVVTITASTVDGGYTATCEVTVNSQ